MPMFACQENSVSSAAVAGHIVFIAEISLSMTRRFPGGANMKLLKTVAVAMTLSMAALAAPASAASLLTSDATYTGPVLDLSAYAGDSYYTFTAGPVSLPGGITYESQNSNSVLGHGGYGLSGNGNTNTTNIIGTNDGFAIVTLTFANAVSMFGGGFNYAPNDGAPPVIAAFDEFDNLIASYDLSVDAPISTPFGQDLFAFRGIDGGGVGIKKFQFSGSYMVLAGEANVTGGVPEPATWGLMIMGFGLAGAMVRSRRRAVA